jgi:hypothetical protein
MDPVKYFKQAWEIYVGNFVTIILASLAAHVIGVLSLMVLYFPLVLGLQMMFVRAKRGEEIKFGDLFIAFDRAITIIIANVIIGLLIVFGLILFILPGLIMGAWWMFALFYIYDKKMRMLDAMNASRKLVEKGNLWMHLVLLILAMVVSQFGTYVFTLGVVFTLPLGMGAIACAYEDQSQKN